MEGEVTTGYFLCSGLVYVIQHCNSIAYHRVSILSERICYRYDRIQGHSVSVLKEGFFVLTASFETCGATNKKKMRVNLKQSYFQKIFLGKSKLGKLV